MCGTLCAYLKIFHGKSCCAFVDVRYSSAVSTTFKHSVHSARVYISGVRVNLMENPSSIQLNVVFGTLSGQIYEIQNSPRRLSTVVYVY